MILGVPAAYLIDATPSPDGSQIIYSTTHGLTLGSDTWLTNRDGSVRRHLFTSAGLEAITGLFSWSPDSRHIVYERLADSATPFLNAGLWLMDRRGDSQQRLADTDGGHGFTPTWSPDSRNIAFVVRANPHDAQANFQAQALQSAISVININSKRVRQVASPQTTGAQLNINPVWSNDSVHITFAALNAPNRVLGGTPHYCSVSLASSSIHPAVTPISPAIQHVAAMQY
jgi:dipeptidyl aminopeptidase/acylaminoacyl peptidase